MTCSSLVPQLKTWWRSMSLDTSLRRFTKRIFTRRQLVVWFSQTAWPLASLITNNFLTSIVISTTTCLRLRHVSRIATTIAWNCTLDLLLNPSTCFSISRNLRENSKIMRTGTLSPARLRKWPDNLQMRWSIHNCKSSSRRARNSAAASSISNERITSYLWKPLKGKQVISDIVLEYENVDKLDLKITLLIVCLVL